MDIGRRTNTRVGHPRQLGDNNSLTRNLLVYKVMHVKYMFWARGTKLRKESLLFDHKPFRRISAGCF